MTRPHGKWHQHHAEGASFGPCSSALSKGTHPKMIRRRKRLVGPLLTLGAIVAVALISGAAEARASDARMTRDCTSSSASVQPLAKIANTRDRSFDCVGLSVDDHAHILAIRFEKHTLHSPRLGAEPEPAIHIREFTPAEIASTRGAVLDGAPGHDALTLRGNLEGGNLEGGQTYVPLVLTFLYNGLTGESRACRIALIRGTDRVWHLFDTRRHQVSQVLVKTWGLPVIGTVGIQDIEGICPVEG